MSEAGLAGAGVWACCERSSGMTRGGGALLLAALVGPGDFAFGAAVTAGFAGAGSGSDPRRPTLRDSRLRKLPSLALAFALAGALRGAGTATIGSLLLLLPDDVKLKDGAVSGAFGMVAWDGTVPGAGR